MAARKKRATPRAKARAKGTRSGPAPKRAAHARAKPRATRRAPSLPVPAALLSAKALADVVEVPARTVLAIEGAGGPEQEPFQRSVGALYGVAYTLKFARKPAGGDFKIGPLEGRWWAEGAHAARATGVPPRETWRWRLRLGVPDDVNDHEVADLIQAVTMKKGGKLEGSADARRVTLERIPAATMGRILHAGPYAEEPASFERIRVALSAAGRTGGDAHLEVYLSDPRRTTPEKLKTALLLEIASA